MYNRPTWSQPRARLAGKRERDRERGVVSGGELPHRTIMRGLNYFVYFNSSLLVLLIFLNFLLSSLFGNVSYLVDRFVLHPLICSLLCYVAMKRRNDLMKQRALLGYASRWRGVREERRVYHTTWQHSLGGESRSVCVCVLVSQLPTRRH